MWNENHRIGLRLKSDMCVASVLVERSAVSPRQLGKIHMERPAESSVSWEVYCDQRIRRAWVTGEKKSESCLLSVTEGDVKLILINVERRTKVKLGPVVPLALLALMMWESSWKQSNTNKVKHVLLHPTIYFLNRLSWTALQGGWSLSQNAVGKRYRIFWKACQFITWGFSFVWEHWIQHKIWFNHLGEIF